MTGSAGTPGTPQLRANAVSIRHFQSTDATALADLYARSVRHYGPRAYMPAQVEAWATTISAEKLAQRCGDGRLALVATDAAGEALGFADLEDDGHIDFLYVAPEAEGRHVGSLLYAALEAHARAHRIDSLHVEASALAMPLFERRGFVLIGRNALWIGEVPIHNFRMEKRL